MRRKTHYVRNFFVLILIGVLVYMGYYVYEKTDVFIIKDISVMGNMRITEDELKDYLLTDELHFFKLNQYELDEKLLAYPKVKTGVIKKVFPDRLEIVVDERMPVVALEWSEQYLLVDEELVVVEVASSTSGYYPIHGYKFENFNIGCEIKDNHRYILENAMFLAFMIMNYDALEQPAITIEENKIFLSVNDNLRVEFGDGDNMEERFNKMVGVYEKLQEDGIYSGVIKVFHDGYPTFDPFEE
ncbi:FtsQ-type POTRA domain-containing protein [Acidaminobacter sp. JC074]|uniref:cell division protein FtsQ/DivIB n=1 Tax=Acidaminobacter sp. JC074 TaxID=2530199 RepID=UPI001F1056B0|nr:FtsQ-type POTRA domain-containing protein [Acidaminobacter sp. JC074]MCH4890222.1 FtsQ-type POTRA domain-containing protein [Acidaminobacter sp. JC074]